MKESIGYTVTLNIAIVFIILVFAFLFSTLIFFRGNKAGKIITNSIEKYEGYNTSSQTEINTLLRSWSYNMRSINCSQYIAARGSKSHVNKDTDNKCVLSNINGETGGEHGYCVYLCVDDEYHSDQTLYYHYKIKINMLFNMPFSTVIDLPVYFETNTLYNFEDRFLTDNGIYNYENGTLKQEELKKYGLR